MSTVTFISIICLVLGVGSLVVTFILNKKNRDKFITERKLLNDINSALTQSKMKLEEIGKKIDTSVANLTKVSSSIEKTISNTNSTATTQASNGGFKPATDEEKKTFEESKKK